MGCRTWLALATGAAIVVAAHDARALPAGVTILVDPCTGVPAPFVERVVSAELSGEGERDAEARAVDVRVTCRDGLVVLEATTTSGVELMTRSIDLEHEDAAARPRVLSVAIAELIASIRARPAPPPPKPPEPPPPPAAEPIAPPAPPPSAHPWNLGISAVTRGFSTLTGFGGGVSASYLTRAHLGFRSDVDFITASVGVSLGSVGARLASFGAQGIAGTTWGAFSLDGGAGVRLGVASLEGHPNANAVGHTVTGAWGGPIAIVALRWSFAPAWSIAATGEGGWVARATTGLVADAPTVSIENGWWSAGLGVAWSP